MPYVMIPAFPPSHQPLPVTPDSQLALPIQPIPCKPGEWDGEGHPRGSLLEMREDWCLGDRIHHEGEAGTEVQGSGKGLAKACESDRDLGGCGGLDHGVWEVGA